MISLKTKQVGFGEYQIFKLKLGECPYLPCKMTIAAFSAYMGCLFTFPFAVMSKEMIEYWPKENGVCTW